MKKIFILLLAIISFMFIGVRVYAGEMPEITNEEMTTLYEEAKAKGVYLIGTSPTTITFFVKKDFHYEHSEAQKWNEVYNSWSGISSPNRDTYQSELFDVIIFSNLSDTKTFYRVYFDGLVIYVNTAEDNSHNIINNFAQDETYTDKYGGLKVTWSDKIVSASKYHVILKRSGSSTVLFEDDISSAEHEYVFETTFYNTYDVVLYPKYGTGDQAFSHENLSFELEDLKPYMSVNDIKVSIEGNEYEWNKKPILPNTIKFEYETRDSKTYELDTSDYTYTPGNLGVGNAHGVLTGKNNLLGSKNVNYKIVERNLADTSKNRIVGLTSQEQTGHQIKPNIKVEFLPTPDGNWEELDSNNYDIEYGENKTGLGSVTVVGKNNCKGKLTGEFEIIGGGSGVSDNDGETTIELVKPTATISANNNVLTIDWDSQEAAIKYELHRSTDGKKYKKIASIYTNTYADKGLTYGKTYYY